MWTLILFTFWSLTQSSDSGSSLAINGFSSKENCEKAGIQIIKDAGHESKFKRSSEGMSNYRTSAEKTLYFNFQCVEVK